MRVNGADDAQGDFRPRVIIWTLTKAGPQGEGDAHPRAGNEEELTRHECLLVIDSIARLSKPIVVLTGPDLSRRTDLHEIVSYATALGLKMIVELQPEEYTEELLDHYRPFGPRIFRIVLDRRIVEDPDTRYHPSPEFLALESAVRRMRERGYEIHFSLTVTGLDLRQLGYNIDYAFRRAAKGLYCHLRFDEEGSDRQEREEEENMLAPDSLIGKISELKPLIPSNMYFSPQCVKYGPYQPEEQFEPEFGLRDQPRWMHWCLAGKSFAFIDGLGKVDVCGGLQLECGDLRKNGYDFEKIWLASEIFTSMREHCWTCMQTREQLKEPAADGWDHHRSLHTRHFED